METGSSPTIEELRRSDRGELMEQCQAERGRAVMTDAYERVGAAYRAARADVYDRHPAGYHGGWNPTEAALILELGEAEIDLHRLRGSGKYTASTPPESAEEHVLGLGVSAVRVVPA